MLIKVRPQQLRKMAVLFVVMISHALTSCASRPLAEPSLPDLDLVTAHVGVITSSDHGYINIASWHGREISDDVAALRLDFANSTFTQVSEIGEASPPPERVDLLLDIGYVIATDTKKAMGWSADTSEIAVKWELSHRDGTPLWSERFVGKATNRPGPVWNSLEKQNERIKIALQHVLVDSIAKIQESSVRDIINIASWHGREISDDVAALRLDFANSTFTQVSEIGEASPPPERVDLLLDIGYVIATDTKKAMGWSADTSEIAVKWELSHRDGTPLWSERFVGKATNRPGPVWNSLEKQNERIKIALQHVLVDSIAKIQESSVREQIYAAVERANEIRQSEAEEAARQ